MANTLVYVGVAVVLIAILFLIAAIQNSVDESRLMATPTIPRSNAVFTSFASTKIKANPEEVFAVITNFEGYDTWSTSFTDYRWHNKQLVDGLPGPGSTGTFQLSFEGFGSRPAPFEITLLDQQKRRIALRTTMYPKWLLGSERVQEVVPIEGKKGWSEYRTYHTVEGVAAYYLLVTATEELNDGQRRTADELKNLLERRAA